MTRALGSSGFANTDFDLPLKKHCIHQLIIVGLIAHMCVEATVRYAAELGYEVTMAKERNRVCKERRAYEAARQNMIPKLSHSSLVLLFGVHALRAIGGE